MRRITTLLISSILAVGGSIAQPLQRFAFEEPHMGTPFRMVLYAPDSIVAHQAAGAAFARIAALDAFLSNYRADSELMQLVATAGTDAAVRVSDDLWTVLAAAQELATQTDGAFDVSIGPLAKLWRRAFRRQALPDSSTIQYSKARVGYDRIVLDSLHQAVTLATSGMLLDLGGIAKGYAVDEALGVLVSYGINSALVDGGGDIAVSDAPPSALGWRIAVSTVDHVGSIVEQERYFVNQAVATSGDTYRYLQIGETRYSHLIDPRSGVGVTHQALVTVIAPTGIEADALASAISVLGAERGFALIQNRSDVTARWVQRHDSIHTQHQSPRFEYLAPLLP